MKVMSSIYIFYTFFNHVKYKCRGLGNGV